MQSPIYAYPFSLVRRVNKRVTGSTLGRQGTFSFLSRVKTRVYVKKTLIIILTTNLINNEFDDEY